MRAAYAPPNRRWRMILNTLDHEWRTASPRGEEGQQHFAFLADEAEKLLRLPSLLSLQVDLTHDDRPDRRVLDLGVGLGDRRGPFWLCWSRNSDRWTSALLCSTAR